MKTEVNGILFEAIHFICPDCGAIDDIRYEFKESNRAIQARCVCDKWIGNVKYDSRSQSEIKKEKIKQWLQKEARHDCA